MSDRQTVAGPLRIGLTGGIGAGKSTVAALFAARGAAIVDADRLAREVVEPGEPALAALAAEFGAGVLDAEGALDRAALARAAFASQERTEALNAIMHPAIAARTRQRMSGLGGHEVVVHDVPLLVENGLSPDYHLSVLVDVPAAVRLERLVTARGLDRDDARRRIAQQADDAARYAACDAILDNSGTEARLTAQFDRLWQERVAPFARGLRTGVLPQRAEGCDAAGERGGDDRAGAARRAVWAHRAPRLEARIRRALGRAGLEAAQVEAAQAGAAEVGPAFTVRVPSRGAEAAAALASGGWLPAGRGGALRSADPCMWSTVEIAGSGAACPGSAQ